MAGPLSKRRLPCPYGEATYEKVVQSHRLTLGVDCQIRDGLSVNDGPWLMNPFPYSRSFVRFFQRNTPTK
jgi:hypothetical protein